MQDTAQPQNQVFAIPTSDVTLPPPLTATPNIATDPSTPTTPVSSGDGGIGVKPKRRITGRVVATIFGLILLVGGIGAGIVLIGQPQILNQSAQVATNSCVTAQRVQNGPNCGQATSVTVSLRLTNACGTSETVRINKAQNTCSYPYTYTNSSGQQTTITSGCVQGSCPPHSELTYTEQSVTVPANGSIVVQAVANTNSCGAAQADVTYGDVGSGGQVWNNSGCSSATTPPSCGSTCTSDSQCPTGMSCTTAGVCRKTECPTETNCVCPTTTATATAGTAPQCTGIKIYDANFTEIPTSDYSKLAPGTQIKIAVTGTTPSGNFDMARFFVNDAANPIGQSSTTVPSNPAEFYIDYTIPSEVTTFTISAELHIAGSGADQWI